MALISNLPDEILLSIFKCFQDRDLVAAAQVCKRWNRLSGDPQLWRSRTFEFRGYCRSQKERIQQSIQKYLELHGRHLRKLTVLCPSPNLLTAFCVAQCVESVLLGMCSQQKNCQSLREFHMCHLNFDDTWESFRSSRYILMESIKHFLKRQTSLKVFNMSDNFMSSPFASPIMRCLIRSKSTRTLEKVDIVDLYQSCKVSYYTISQHINSLTTRCYNLKEIALNYSYLYATSVVTLCQNLQGSLQKIYISLSFWEYSHYDEIISSKDWALVRDLIPGLKVVVFMSFWCTDPTIFLDKTMPLHGLEIKGGQCRYSHQTYAAKSAILVSYLARYFASTLRFIVLNAEGVASNDNQFELSFTKFLSSCNNLEKVVISDNLLNVEQVCLRDSVKQQIARGLDIKFVSRKNCADFRSGTF